MATTMLLVTQDRYLFQGIKVFYPDIMQLHSIERMLFEGDADEFSVLIDSRAPLSFYKHLILDAAQAKKRICCIVLDMRHREGHLLSLNWFLNMSPIPENMTALFTLFLEVKGKRLTKAWLRNLRLSSYEKMMIRRLNTGKAMGEIASELNTSVKSLYRKRIELYERYGLDNFNEVCLFIFKNSLLDASGEVS